MKAYVTIANWSYTAILDTTEFELPDQHVGNHAIMNSMARRTVNAERLRMYGSVHILITTQPMDRDHLSLLRRSRPRPDVVRYEP